MEEMCPNCQSEDTYHNGVSFECNDCENTWGDTPPWDEEE
jgi:uncharacterized Zn ribbon protein